MTPPLPAPAAVLSVLTAFQDTLRASFPSGWPGAALFLAIWLAAGYGLVRLFNRVVHARASRSQNKVDDIVVDALRRPLYIGLLLTGIYVLATVFGVFPASWTPALRLVVPVLIALTVPFALVQVVVGLLGLHAERRPEFRAVRGTVEFAVRLVVYALALLLVMDHLGVEITPLLAAFGIGGLAVALALQDTLANFFAGMYLSLDRPLRDGDYVELEGGIKGFVVDVSWRSVRVRELSNNVFVIPNSKVAAGVIKNYDLPVPEMACLVQVSVAYRCDLALVERVTVDTAREVLRTTPGGVPAFEPFIRYHTFGDHGIGFTVILRVRTFVDQYLVTHEFIKALHERYRKEGIEIPFPQRTLHLAVAGNAGDSQGHAAGGPPALPPLGAGAAGPVPRRA